ncbi:MAG: MFS transporter [Lentisphaeria bacterium]|nr:MFS transporter [Candidatus Neomarinimicrobiota bacterium]MCF7842810.1 MFS transporter [Lentisphaeria bacterium]
MAGHSNSPGRERFAVALLAIITLFLFADQNLMAPNLTQIADDFGFDAVERDVMLGGNISFVFWVFGGLVTLGIGYLTDRISRKALFIAVILVGEIPCLLTGFAQTYSQLFWLRALTGIGIGGALPLVYSLLGDYFSPKLRTAASAYMALAMGLGIAVGQLLAGFIGPEYGWRLPFILVALPNFLLALVFWFTMQEPSRGQAEEGLKDLLQSGQIYTARINWSEYKQLFRIKTNLLIFLQGIPGTVPWGVFFIFLNDYLSQDKGYTIETATLIVTIIGGAAIFGGFLGGLMGHKLYNLNPKYLPALCGITTLLGIIPTAILINIPDQSGVANPNLMLPLVSGLFTGFTISITGPNVKAMLLNVNLPETRGSIFSLFNLTDDLGKGFGPVIISILIVSLGRTWAFNVANLFWLFCGVTLLWLIWIFPRDERRLNSVVMERAASLQSKRPI